MLVRNQHLMEGDIVMNDNVKNYLESYVPDNHWLSKSMEIGKIEYGSYWYLKKMIVYYYIFILKRLDRREIQEIISNFDLYIDSLPQEIKQEAFDFFYAIDIRHEDSIITLNEFSSTNELLDNYEAEMLRARKFYYSYIMGLQAQNPEKRYILNKTIERRNYFIGVEEAEQKLTSAKFRQQSNDVHAFLRNERQILFLMGLLNYTESINIEEFTPTTIGQTAVYANFNDPPYNTGNPSYTRMISKTLLRNTVRFPARPCAPTLKRLDAITLTG